MSVWKSGTSSRSTNPDVRDALERISAPSRPQRSSTSTQAMVEQERSRLESFPLSDAEAERLLRILAEGEVDEPEEEPDEAPAAPAAPPKVETAIEGTTPEGVGGSLAEPEDEIRLTLTSDLRNLLIQQQQAMQNSTMARAMRVEVSLEMVVDFLLREAVSGYTETSTTPLQLGTAPQAKGLVRDESTELPQAPAVSTPTVPKPVDNAARERALQAVASMGWSQSSVVPSGQVAVHAHYVERGWVRMVAYRSRPTEDPTERRHYAQIENTAQYQIADNERIFYWYPQPEEYPDWKSLDPELHPACQRHTPEPNRIPYRERGSDLNGRPATRAMLPWGPVDGLHQDWSV